MRKYIILLIVFFISLNLFANEFVTKDNNIRLVINNRTGSFSLFYRTCEETMRYEPLFNHRTPSASFIEVNVNGRSYRLGTSRSFTTRFEIQDNNPAVIYESAFLTVNKVFSPVRTPSSPVSNGVKITITVRNTSNAASQVGLRKLIDTHLGERRRAIPFITNNLNITHEMIIEGSSNENFWISRGRNLALMGSIANPTHDNNRPPDFIHFANWRRLRDAPWRLHYREGRSFNFLPYSVRDSAVCYYWLPQTLNRGEAFTFTIFLTTADISWFTQPDVTPVFEQPLDHGYFEGMGVREAEIPVPVAVIEAAPQPSLIQEFPQAAEIPQIQETQEAPQIDEIPIHIFSDETMTLNIPAIEDAALQQAWETGEDANILTLVRLQEILNQFISGEIVLSRQDLVEIEQAMDRHTRH